MSKIAKESKVHFLFLMVLSIMGVSSFFFDPAYLGYSIAFALLLLTKVVFNRGKSSLLSMPLFVVVLLLIAPFILLQTIVNDNGGRDVFRDLGALFAFYVGYAVIPGIFANFPNDWRLVTLKAISNFGLFVVAFTIIGAVRAYLAGVDAYFWRGMYVPFVHNWLPYIFVINIGLARLDESCKNKYLFRTAFCFLGTVASLSRTDVVLMLFVIFVLFITNFRKIILTPSSRGMFLYTFVFFAVAGVFFFQLDAVQERLRVGVGDDDSSLAWRYIENFAFIDYYLESSFFSQILGFGLGARLPLPYGVVDFDGNGSIPHLHNSIFTIALKFGALGTALFFAFVIYAFRSWRSRRDTLQSGAMFAGGWILIFVLGKALTLQGLSEWSHVMFFGLSIALIIKPIDQTSNAWLM